MDIELAVDVMDMAAHADHIVLFSGDGDFRRLVEAIQRRGVRVTVISTLQSHPAMIADELRRQADVFVDLASIKDDITRVYRDQARPVPRAPVEVVEEEDFDDDDEDYDDEDEEEYYSDEDDEQTA